MINDKINKLKKIKINKETIKENKLKVFLSFIVLIIIIALIIGEQSLGIFSLSFNGEAIVQNKLQNLKFFQKRLENEQDSYRKLLNDEAKIIAQKRDYYIESNRNGGVDEFIQALVVKAATKDKIDISSSGSVQISKIGDGISSGGLEISCSGNFLNMVQFIYDISYSSPKMFWDRFSLRPNNYNDPSVIYMSGYMKFIIIDNKEIENLLNTNKNR